MALEHIPIVARNEAGIAAALAILKQRFGERFLTGADFRRQHGHATTYIPSQPPDGVAFVENRVLPPI
jgi:D-lactate dehydrogenase (cytochrome)